MRFRTVIRVLTFVIDSVEAHYGLTELGASILSALADDGKDVDHLTVHDLAPVDEFHIRGRESTLELAGIAGLAPGMNVLDIGSGIGGSARHLASAHDCTVTGIDATKEYCDVATMLSGRVGLAHRTTFTHGSALDVPYPHASFDLAWTEHVQMNIEDKETFYGEIARVLAPGGRFVFHDVFLGPAGKLRYPVPWADEASLSHLIAPGDVSELLGALGFAPIEWRDVTEDARAWFHETTERVKRGATNRAGIHLLMGATAADKFANMGRNLDENRVNVIQAVLTKTS